MSRRFFCAAVVAALALGTGAPLSPAHATVVLNADYEGNDGTTWSGVVQDCAVRHTGSCSAKVLPSGSTYISARTPVANGAMTGLTTVTFAFRGESISSDVDTSLRLVLDVGGVTFDPTYMYGPNTRVVLGSDGFATTPEITRWPSENTWYTASITLDPVANRVTATVLGASGSTDIHADASRITAVEVGGVRWSALGGAMHYDSVKIDVVSANSPPALPTIVSPTNNTLLPYNGQHRFSVRATDPQNDLWSAGVEIYNADSGALRASLGTPFVASGQTATTSALTLAPGNYYWTAYAEDDKRAYSATTGRTYFRVSGLAFGTGSYVALGDSYSSGEGAPSSTYPYYWPGTANPGVNICHRSNESWPVRISRIQELPDTFRFAACSGAETRNLNNEPRWNEPLQLSQITADTSLVTMSMGGNDAGFGTIIAACVKSFNNEDCWQHWSAYFDRRLNRLNAPAGSTPSQADVQADPDIVNVRPLAEVYQLIRDRAPDARVVITGYPALFTTGLSYTCSGVRANDQASMNAAATRLNDVLEARTLEAGFEFVDVERAMDGHRLCSWALDWINGIGSLDIHEDFHPKVSGHEAISWRVLDQILAPTAPAPCTPAAPGAVGVSNAKATTLDVSWPAPANCGIEHYRVFRNGVEVPASSACYRQPATTCRDTGLNPSTTYSYTVQAVSLAAQGSRVSGTSAPASGTTMAQNPMTPTVPSGTTNVTTATTATYTTSATDPTGDDVRYVFNWGDGTTCTTGYVASGTAGSCAKRWPTVGTYCVKSYAQDVNGAVGPTSTCKNVNVANANPNRPTIPSGPTSVVTGASAAYSTYATDVDGNSVRYVFDWGDGTTSTTAYGASGATGTASHVWSTAGSYCVKAYAEQDIGGISTWSSCRYVTVTGNRAPGAPTVPSGPSSISTATTATYTSTATDPDGNTVRYVFEWSDGTTCTTAYGASGTAGSCAKRWTSVGTYCVRSQAQDSAGVSSGWSTCKVVEVTNAYPDTPSVPSGPTSLTTAGTGGYSTSATDADGNSLRYVFDWGDGSTSTTAYGASGATGSASHTWAAPGTYCVRVYAEQDTGGTSLWSGCLSVTVTQANRAPAVPAAPSGPANISTASTASYSASSSDPDGNTVRYVFDWSDGTATCATGYVSSGTAASCSKRFASVGTYCVRAQAQDPAGAVSAWSPCKVVDVTNGYPDTPSVPAGATAVYKGESGSYSASATDVDGNNLRYVFDWGDGTTSTTAYGASGATGSASHVWGAAGSYCVKVYAEQDVGGTSLYSGCLTVTVSGPANDDFAAATVTSGTTQATRGATTQAGEPLCPNMTRTVWFKFTPGTTGTYRITTSGSSYDTVLGIYTGSSLTTLGGQQCNDDADSTTQSRIDTPMAAGSTYYVQVGGYGIATGNLSVSMSRIGGL